MSEMIERVARAICAQNGLKPDTLVLPSMPPFGPKGCLLFADAPEQPLGRKANPIPAWHLFIGEANAAIEAMREPTEAMKKAGEFRFHKHEHGQYPALYLGESGLNSYDRMIDAALKPD